MVFLRWGLLAVFVSLFVLSLGRVFLVVCPVVGCVIQEIVSCTYMSFHVNLCTS